jgi:YD repeat-containing protein
MLLATVRNSGSKPMNGVVGGQPVDLNPDDMYPFTDACELVRFVNQNGSGITDNQAGDAVRQINAAAEQAHCSERIDASVVTTAPASPGSANLPDTGDSPEAQGAPSTTTQATISVEHGPYGEPDDPRQPTEAMHDRGNPQSEGEIRDGELSRGATDQEADSAVDRALHGEPPVGEARTTHSGDAARGPTHGGPDPVDLFSGLLVVAEVDLEVPTPLLGLQLQRTYLSGRPYFGPWGFNWDHNWNVYLRELATGEVARWNGRLHEDVFRATTDGFESPRGVFDRLRQLPGPASAYEADSPGGIVSRYERPEGWADTERIPLTSITDRAGNSITLAYDTADRLVRLEDDDGRGLRFTYGTCGLLEHVEDHAGRRVDYLHDDDVQHLCAVVLPPTSDFPSGLSTSYDYDADPGHPAMRHNIVRVIDNEENVVLENSYGNDPADVSFNRIVRQVYGDDVFAFEYSQIQWVPSDPLFADVPMLQTSISFPDCSLWTYSFNYAGELLDERFRLVADGSYRIVATTRAYDIAGNLSSLTRADGSTTLWTYDAASPDPRMRGTVLRIERTAPSTAPVGSRIVLRAEYEPDYQLPRRTIAENGAQTRFLYDFDLAPSPAARGALVQIEWPDATAADGSVQASSTVFETNARGQTTAAVSPAGVRDEIVYEPGGSTLAGFLSEYRADVGGALEVTAYAYDGRGHLSAQTQPGGARTEYVYNSLGDLEQQRLPPIEGVVDVFHYTYDSRRQIAATRRPRGAYDDEVTVDAFILDTNATDLGGHVVETVWGANTAFPRRWSFATDFEGRPTTITAPDGSITKRCHDERGLLLRETQAVGSPVDWTTRLEYDVVGRLVRRIEPGDRTTSFAYDPWGRLANVMLPNGSEARTSWSAFDQPLSYEVVGDPGDGSARRVLRRVEHAYDERGRPIRRALATFEQDPATAVELEEERYFDGDGHCVRRIGPRGGEWRFVYDGRGRLASQIDPLGNVTETIFGPDGLPQRITVGDLGDDGTAQRFIDHMHDARGRLIRTVSSAGIESITSYDARDLPIELVGRGSRVRQRFGLLGELHERLVDPDGLALSHRWEYDLVDRPIRYIDPTGEETHSIRDALGRVVSVELADGGKYERTFDMAGDPVEARSPDGSRIFMSADGAGRIVSVSAVPSPGRLPIPPHSYVYDGLDRLVRAAAGGSAVTRRFDSLDRMVEEVSDGVAFLRQYDDLNGRYRLQFPDGRVEEHIWDVLGRIERVTLVEPGGSAIGPVSGMPGSSLLELRYVGPDRIDRIAHGNGTTSLWSYDLDGRLTLVDYRDPADESLDSIRYRHDSADHRRLIERSGPPAENHLLSFDARGRVSEWRTGFASAGAAEAASQADQDSELTVAAEAAASAGLVETYDLDGSDTRTLVRRTEDSAPPAAITYGQAAGHRVIQVGSATYNYDADGRRTADDRRLVTYDCLGRVVSVDAVAGGNVVTHAYDPLGRWVAGEVDGAAVRRRYFGGQCLQEQDANGEVIAQRTQLPTMLVHLVETRETGPLHLHLNGHHDLALATDLAGSIAERYRFEPFGTPTILDADGAPLSASAVGLTPIFGGMPFIAPAGLYFTPRRYYEPRTGLFLARDDLLHVASACPYVFVIHDPADLVDPDGENPLVVAGLVVGAIGAVVGIAMVVMRGGDYDAWDIAAAGAIGFGAGFVGAVTFGWASGVTGGALVAGTATTASSAAGGAALASASVGVNVVSGVVGGAVSGGASGVFSGGARATYQWWRHGGDLGSMVARGVEEEALSGVVSGAVGGGLFQGALRIGALPRGAWAGLRAGTTLPTRMAVIVARGVASPYGAGAAGMGFASAYSGGVTRRLLEGESLAQAADESVEEGLWGAGTGFAAAEAHPTTWQYWRARLSPRAAAAIQAARAGGAHHQRNVATYPELATPRPNTSLIGPLEQRYGRYITQGNIQGEFSDFSAGATYSHRQLHELWRFGQTGSWTSWSTHGPWTPAWQVSSVPADPRAENHRVKAGHGTTP